MDFLTGFLLISGFFKSGSVGSPSQLGRLILAALSLYVLRRSPRFFTICIMGATYVIALELVSFFLLHHNPKGFFSAIISGYKPLLFLFVVLTYFFFKHKKQINAWMLLSYGRLSALIYGFNVIICAVLEIGAKTYGSGTFGTKGFVPSNNGLSMVLGVYTLVSLFMYLKTRKSKDFVYFSLICLSCLLVGAKTSLIFPFVAFLVLFIKMNLWYKLYLIAFVGVWIFSYFEVIVTIFRAIFDVVIYRFENNASFWTFIASSRDKFVIEAFNQYDLSGWWVLRILFGLGAFVSFRNPNSINQMEMLETDLFDVFFRYGLVLILICAIVVFWAALSNLYQKRYLLFLTWCLAIIFSSVAGHVVFNGMSTTVIQVLFVVSVWQKEENEDTFSV